MTYGLWVLTWLFQTWAIAASLPSTSTANFTVAERCAVTSGTWCRDFHAQSPVTWRPAPRGDKSCQDNCNNVGNCNYDFGWCECPAGWTGHDCKTRQKRSCTNRVRLPHENISLPLSHTGPDGKDLNWKAAGFTDSRCAGICDEDLGSCWCMEGKYSHILPPVGSPPGTPPVKRGRPLAQCGFEKDKDGEPSDFGYFKAPSYDSLYGPDGWCNADKPPWRAYQQHTPQYHTIRHVVDLYRKVDNSQRR